MSNKLNVLLLFGGKSTEHQISILSAINVNRHLSREKYSVHLVGIDQEGDWYYHGDQMNLSKSKDSVTLVNGDRKVILSQNANDKKIIDHEGRTVAPVDVVYPVLHGFNGEDGSIQGLAKLADLPCVGPDILGSAVGIDKEIMKRILRDNGLLVADFVTIRKFQTEKPSFDLVRSKLGVPMFIKPANMGSSVGISKVDNEKQYEEALMHAFSFDDKIIVEKAIIGRELECAVKGYKTLQAAAIGEVVVSSHFYDYETKYLDESKVETHIPARLSKDEENNIKTIALQVCEYLECRGITRVDVFLTTDGDVIINEVNTLPGFTDVSMYPLLWKEKGVDFEQLLDDLITYSIDKSKQQRELRSNY